MTSPIFHLAQVNIARMLAPLDEPLMAGFVALLDEVNAAADASPGFVWRFQNEQGNATYLRPFADDRILFNLSVWESVEALKAYVYLASHADVMRRRKEWFAKFDAPYPASWRVPAGHRPSVAEAKDRLDYLRRCGPTAFAFLPTRVFMPEPATAEPWLANSPRACPA